MELNRENIKTLLLDLIAENSQQTRTDKKLSEAHAGYLRWAEFNLSKKTISGVHTAFKHLISFRGDVPLSEINSHFISLFMNEIMKKVPKGYRVYFRSLRAEFNKYVEWSFIPVNHFTKYKLPKQQRNEKKYFSENEFVLLVEAEHNHILKAIYLISFYTGLRLSEVLNLVWENVHLKGKYVLIGDENFITKTCKVRRVPLCVKASNILENHIPKIYHTIKKNYVFRKPNGFPFTSNYISKRFKKLLRGNGYPEEFHFHNIRHSTASNLARLGVAIPQIQQILGHSDIKTTMIYTHTDFSDLVNSISVFDNSSQSEVGNGCSNK